MDESNEIAPVFTSMIHSARIGLTLNLGLRFDHQTGKNLASTIPGYPGFEDVCWSVGISRAMIPESHLMIFRHASA